LALQLYSSSARFLFELLQNADDNHYRKAQAAGAVPYVHFGVYPDRIVMECNEDGFTKADLEAICSTGRSSKLGSQGYIGEKGIGFKSVFMAAWKVHVHSGFLTFYFQHRKDDPEGGLGMVRPIWEESQDLLLGPVTRFVLHLHDVAGSKTIKVKQASILKQFRELNATVLLFMRKIKSIDISFYDKNGSRTSTTVLGKEDGNPRVVLTTTTTTADGNSVQAHRRIYYMVEHTVYNLEPNDNRTYTEAEEQSKVYAKSDVVLAFPMDDRSVPITSETQEAFAYMPLRRTDFNVRQLMPQVSNDTIDLTDIASSSYKPISSRRRIARTSKRTRLGTLDLSTGSRRRLLRR
jgi:hypothetical protein